MGLLGGLSNFCVLYIFGILSLSCKTLSPFCRMLLCPTGDALCLGRIFSFMRFNVLIVDFSVCSIHVLSRKGFPVPINSRLFPTFFSTLFSVSDVLWRLINLELSFLQNSVLPEPFAKDDVIF